MPEARANIVLVTVPTAPSRVPCAIYGAALSSKAGGASLILYDHAVVGNPTGANAPLAARRIVLYTSDATSTASLPLSFPVAFSSGLFCSLTSGAHGMVLYRKRS